MNRHVVVGSNLASANLRLKLHAVLFAYPDRPRARKMNPLHSYSRLRALVPSTQDSDFLAGTLSLQIFFYRRLKHLLSVAAVRVPNLCQEIAILIAVENQLPQAFGSAAIHLGGQDERSLLLGSWQCEWYLRPECPPRSARQGGYDWPLRTGKECLLLGSLGCSGP